jgi:dephospho-CoA kinase
MLRVGLTGGIGAGKSTVARRLVELGATVVDADRVAREVVEPGTVGLARVVEAFGAEVLDADGALDRPALAAIVFGDEQARLRLNGILHPLIGERTAELMAAAPPDSVLVQDVPLLVEGRMAPAFPLVLVVDAPEEIRVERLIRDRGMTEAEARARMAAQADRAARQAAADVWLDNSGAPEDVRAVVDRLWHERLLPFEAAVRTGAVPVPDATPAEEPDPTWPDQFDRVAARIARAMGDSALRVDHVGPTSVPGLAAADVLHAQAVVPGGADPEALVTALREVGFVAVGPGAFLGADPGRPVYLYVRAEPTAQWRSTLLLRDWLRSDPDARAAYQREPDGAAERWGHMALDRQEYPEWPPRWRVRSLDGASRWAADRGRRPPVAGPESEPT